MNRARKYGESKETWESRPDTTGTETEGIDIKPSPHRVSSLPFGLHRGTGARLLPAIFDKPLEAVLHRGLSLD